MNHLYVGALLGTSEGPSRLVFFAAPVGSETSSGPGDGNGPYGCRPGPPCGPRRASRTAARPRRSPFPAPAPAGTLAPSSSSPASSAWLRRRYSHRCPCPGQLAEWIRSMNMGTVWCPSSLWGHGHGYAQFAKSPKRTIDPGFSIASIVPSLRDSGLWTSQPDALGRRRMRETEVGATPLRIARTQTWATARNVKHGLLDSEPTAAERKRSRGDPRA